MNLKAFLSLILCLSLLSTNLPQNRLISNYLAPTRTIQTDLVQWSNADQPLENAEAVTLASFAGLPLFSLLPVLGAVSLFFLGYFFGKSQVGLYVEKSLRNLGYLNDYELFHGWKESNQGRLKTFFDKNIKLIIFSVIVGLISFFTGYVQGFLFISLSIMAGIIVGHASVNEYLSQRQILNTYFDNIDRALSKINFLKGRIALGPLNVTINGSEVVDNNVAARQNIKEHKRQIEKIYLLLFQIASESEIAQFLGTQHNEKAEALLTNIKSENGAIGNGVPLRFSDQEFMEKIEATSVKEGERYEKVSQLVADAVQKLMKYQHLMNERIRTLEDQNESEDVEVSKRSEHLKIAVDNYISASSTGNKTFLLHFFDASDWISSEEDYLLGFHRKEGGVEHIGLSVDLILYLKSLEGQTIRMDKKWEIEMTPDLVLTLIAEYVFHELHGEGGIDHHELYENIQRKLLGDLFPDQNVLKIFLRKFINKESAYFNYNRYRITRKGDYIAKNVSDFIDAFTRLYVYGQQLDDAIVLFEEEKDALSYLGQWTLVQLHPDVPPQEIWTYIIHEMELFEIPLEAFQYLFAEAILRFNKNGWPDKCEECGKEIRPHLRSLLLEELQRYSFEEDMMSSGISYLQTIFALNVRLWESNLFGPADFRLSKSHFSGAYLRGIDFSSAFKNYDTSSYGFLLINAYLREANFSGLDLRKFDFSGADLRGAIFSGATLLRSQVLKQGIDLSILKVDPNYPIKIIEDDPLYIERLKQSFEIAI